MSNKPYIYGPEWAARSELVLTDTAQPSHSKKVYIPTVPQCTCVAGKPDYQCHYFL